jgi:hypothetical protein
MRRKYSALSYCAGDPKKIKETLINGTGFNIFANLGEALDEVRYFWKEHGGGKELLLWVD